MAIRGPLPIGGALFIANEVAGAIVAAAGFPEPGRTCRTWMTSCPGAAVAPFPSRPVVEAPMPLVPFNPPPGINKDDSPFAAEGQWSDSDGFRFVKGRPETIGGSADLPLSTAVPRVNRMLVYDDGGTVKLAVAGDSLVASAVNTAGTDLTPAADWTSTNTGKQLAMWGDVLLALVPSGRLFETSGAQAVEVANAPTASTTLLVTPSRQVMLLGTREEGSGIFNGRCIRWSDIEDRTSWTTSSTNNAGEYILPGQEDIVAAALAGDYILVWTKGALWLAQFVGDPSQTFSFARVGGVGICGANAYATYRDTIYWVGRDLNFYAYGVGGPIRQIPCPLARWFRDTATPGLIGSIFGCPNSRFGEVWFGFGSGADDNDKYIAYSVEESIAAQRPVWFSGTLTIGGAGIGAMVESPLLTDQSGTNETQIVAHPAAYGAAGTAFTPHLWDCSTTVQGISGSYIQSADFYLDESRRRSMIRRFVPDFDEQGGTVSLTLTVRDRPMSPAATRGPYAIAATDTKKDFRASGQIANVRFSIAAAVRVRLGKPLFDVVAGGER